MGLWYTSDIYIYLGSQRQNMGQKPNKKFLISFLSDKKSCSLNPVPPSHTLACHEFNMQYNCLEATRGGRWHNWGEWLFFRGNILNDNVLQRIRNSGHIWLCTILFRKGNFKYQNLYFRWSLLSESWILRIQCTMRLSVALRNLNIWKCKGLVFAQFWSNMHQSSSMWS